MADPPRRLEYMPVRDLPGDDRNPKLHAETDLDASIDRWGYTQPVLLDERTGKLISGHGRKAALVRARDAGQHPPDGVAIDDTGEWLVPVVRGWASRSDAEAAGYLAADNQLTVLGGWDGQALLDILDTASGTDLGLGGTGFTLEDVDELNATDPTEPEPGDGGGDEAPGDRTTGELLEVADVTWGEPEHQPDAGDHWRLGHHHLFVTDPFRDWAAFVDTLEPGMLLAPFPEPHITCAIAAREQPFLLIQPSIYLAGHLLDKHAAMFGSGEVTRL